MLISTTDTILPGSLPNSTGEILPVAPPSVNVDEANSADVSREAIGVVQAESFNEGESADPEGSEPKPVKEAEEKKDADSEEVPASPDEVAPVPAEEEDDPFDDFDDEDFDDDFDDDFEEELEDDYEIVPDDSDLFPDQKDDLMDG